MQHSSRESDPASGQWERGRVKEKKEEREEPRAAARAFFIGTPKLITGNISRPSIFRPALPRVRFGPFRPRWSGRKRNDESTSGREERFGATTGGGGRSRAPKREEGAMSIARCVGEPSPLPSPFPSRISRCIVSDTGDLYPPPRPATFSAD